MSNCIGFQPQYQNTYLPDGTRISMQQRSFCLPDGTRINMDPSSYTKNQTNWNLPNSTVGQHGFLGTQQTQGYGLDLNRSGRYEAGRDGVLAFDLNRDGRVSPQEIQRSNQMLNAAGGNLDQNGDGRVTPCERIQGRQMQNQVGRMDQNGDGRLSNWELQNAGARVLVDSNRDGQSQPWEQHSVNNFPTPGFGRGRLNGIDPFFGTNNVTSNQPYFGGNPWGPRPY